MIFLALKTEDGRITGKISFYCRMLGISRQLWTDPDVSGAVAEAAGGRTYTQ